MGSTAARNNSANSDGPSHSDAEQLNLGQQVLQAEAAGILELSRSLDGAFVDAAQRIRTGRGNVIVSGMGKAGLIGKKLAATFSSTGTPSHFVHPAEAVHGDLGRIRSTDVVLMLSFSGETEEVARILPFIVQRSAGLIAMTSGKESRLARAANTLLLLPSLSEACHNGLAPTTSTTMMLALGDALAMVVSQLREFTSQDFASFHPGGALGKRLRRVDEAMRSLSECRVASVSQSIRQVLVQVSRPGRRTGAVMLVEDDGCLCGIFTDSDLAKLLEHRRESLLDTSVADVMTRRFSAIRSGAWLSDAIHVLADRKISELPVINDQDRPLGLIDITDLLEIIDLPHVKADSGLPSDDERPSTIRLFGGP